MRPLTNTLTALALLALGGCATSADLDVVRRDLDELKNRQFQVEKEVGGVRSEANARIESSFKDLDTERVGFRKGLADLQATMDGMKVDMQVLAGKLDDLEIAVKKPGDELVLLREDLERRLTALDQGLTKTETGIEALQKKVAEQAATVSKDTEKPTPEAMYQKGLDAYRAGNYGVARESFTRFLEQHPKHELAANARYWTGETYYSEKKFEQAILEFQEVIRNFPGREKVPAAMLKQAAAFSEIGDAKSARFVLRKLVDDHPSSEEAKRAKDRLKELK
jgi:tol-pal system protein YbgF